MKLSQEVTFELSPEQQEETRPGLAFSSVICVAPAVSGANHELECMEPGRQSAGGRT